MKVELIDLTQETPPAKRQRSKLPVEGPVDDWVCSSCTLINEPGDTICDACETPRTGATQPKQGSLSQQNSWMNSLPDIFESNTEPSKSLVERLLMARECFDSKPPTSSASQTRTQSKPSPACSSPDIVVFPKQSNDGSPKPPPRPPASQILDKEALKAVKTSEREAAKAAKAEERERAKIARAQQRELARKLSGRNALELIQCFLSPNLCKDESAEGSTRVISWNTGATTSGSTQSQSDASTSKLDQMRQVMSSLDVKFSVCSSPLRQKTVMWSLDLDTDQNTVVEGDMAAISAMKADSELAPWVGLILDPDDVMGMKSEHEWQALVQRVQEHFPSRLLVVVLEGWTGFRKTKGRGNMAVRVAETLLFFLEFELHVFVRHTNTQHETALFITRIARELSRSPFKESKSALGMVAPSANKQGKDAAAAMHVDGNSKAGVWAKQLVQIRGVGPLSLQAIHQNYPSWQSLSSVYHNSSISNERKAVMLEGLVLGTRRPVNGPLSQRIHRFFTSTTPTERVETE